MGESAHNGGGLFAWIHADDNVTVVVNATIAVTDFEGAENSAAHDGGAISAFIDSYYAALQTATMAFTRVTVQNNTAGLIGGAVLASIDGVPTSGVVVPFVNFTGTWWHLC